MIKKRKNAGIKHLNDSKAFIQCSNITDEIFESINDYNLKRKQKCLFSMIWLETQSDFSVPEDVRLNLTHYLIMKINSKRDLQNIVNNHSVDIDYNDFVKIYRECTRKPYCF